MRTRTVVFAVCLALCLVLGMSASAGAQQGEKKLTPEQQAAMDAWMIVPGWVRKKSTPREMNCNLEALVNHIDHICQLAGNTNHICIGSDLDGGFGKEQCPYDIDTIADLQKFPALLAARGYDPAAVEAFMYGNALMFLKNAWS